MEERRNCWEFMDCGERGVDCPVRSEECFDGVNHGINGGRVCWAVVGTLCRHENHADWSIKYSDCLKCEFLRYVHKAEGKQFNVG